MPDAAQQHETALRCANLALTARSPSVTNRFASVELRLTDPRTGPWEMAAMAAVALASVLVVIGVWYW